MLKAVLPTLTVLLSTAVVADTRPMDLDDITRLQWVTQARVSPDGRHVAYIRRTPRRPFEDEDGEAWAELHVVSGESGPRPFVQGDVVVSALRWSPDSKGIFFLAKRGPKPEKGEHFNALYAISVDGGEAFEVCAMDTEIADFSLHPDGKRVALVAAPPKEEHVKKLEEKGIKARVYEESVDHVRIYLAEVDNDDKCEPEALDVEGSVVDVELSPDGDRILAAIAPTALIDDKYMQTRLRVLDLEGSVVGRVENPGKLGAAVWSPDGDRIAYLGVTDINDPREGRLKVADVGSGEIRNLLPDLPAHVMDLAWNGDHIDALVHFGVESELWSVDPRSGRHRILVAQGEQVVRRLHRSASGKRLVVVADSATHPEELFDVDGGSLERLSDSNPWLAERRLARQTTVAFTARDGEAMEGLLIHPLDFAEGKRYPLIIFVHGGPESHRSDGWLTTYSQPVQVAAAAGYASFVPNYRGSTGKGVAFTKLHQHNYATPEFDDIVDGKNHLVEMGLVDADRVGITGGSYGGYATAWSATALSEHYAAGVMFVGISNQISKTGTTDIPHEMHLVHARAWPWEDWQWFLERSPIYHARDANTPLLIMHGDSDPRVHPSQSLEMYRYLKLAGKAPVRLVLYPDEKHGNRKAGAQYDYSRRLMRWMDHYLKGPGGEPPHYELDYSDQLEALEEESD